MGVRFNQFQNYLCRRTYDVFNSKRMSKCFVMLENALYQTIYGQEFLLNLRIVRVSVVVSALQQWCTQALLAGVSFASTVWRDLPLIVLVNQCMACFFFLREIFTSFSLMPLSWHRPSKGSSLSSWSERTGLLLHHRERARTGLMSHKQNHITGYNELNPLVTVNTFVVILKSEK